MPGYDLLHVEHPPDGSPPVRCTGPFSLKWTPDQLPPVKLPPYQPPEHPPDQLAPVACQPDVNHTLSGASLILPESLVSGSIPESPRVINQ